jgi:hypothetical protein
MSIFVRINSHRAADKMDRAIGRHPQYYWTLEHGGCFAEVTEEEFDRIRTIRGITKARVPRKELRQCWDF